MKRLTVIALLATVLAGCATRREPPWDGKIFDDNLRGRGAGPPMPPPLDPAVQMAVSAERQRQINRYRPKTPHLLMQPGDTNRFVGPTQPPKL